MTPKESNNFIFVFVQLVYFLNRFGVKIGAKFHQILNIQFAFEGVFADFGWKMTQNVPLKVENVKIFVDF